MAAATLAEALKQTRPFASREEEVVLALQHLAARVTEPWALFLKATAQLTVSQYNVLRILRGAHPSRLTCGEISQRMVARDPDVTRLVDRLEARGLVDRARDTRDRRVVGVGITRAGLAVLKQLDPAVERYPRAMLSRLGPRRVEQLAVLLRAVLSSLGTFPETDQR
ncbi:MAG TPA: MarR family transcriptional regulator [Vicinamibacterales bacterium]|nr:MarR family transcriptional regulator [Vicinamibacterales bacterium]